MEIMNRYQLLELQTEFVMDISAWTVKNADDLHSQDIMDVNVYTPKWVKNADVLHSQRILWMSMSIRENDNDD